MQPDPVRLTGNVYRGTDAKRPVRPFVVIADAGEESVMVENVDPPLVTRQIKRYRLHTYHYELIGRIEKNGRGVEDWSDPSTFDGPRFGSWLRKWMSAEGLTMRELAKRSGVSMAMVQQLRTGAPSGQARRRGQQKITPGINTIAAIAHGLGLELGYVLSRGGLGDRRGRWANFTEAERIALAIALGAESDEDDLDALLENAVQPPKEPVS